MIVFDNTNEGYLFQEEIEHDVPRYNGEPCYDPIALEVDDYEQEDGSKE